MNKSDLVKTIQRYICNIGLSGSSLRNQGASGVVSAARQFLSTVDLSALSMIELHQYPCWLDNTTDGLLSALPVEARRWGAARKATNIFTTQAFLNAELRLAFDLSRLGDVMETPLDSVAANELRKGLGKKNLPRWSTLGDLTREISDAYQLRAATMAKAEGVPRACLDTLLWRPLAD